MSDPISKQYENIDVIKNCLKEAIAGSDCTVNSIKMQDSLLRLKEVEEYLKQTMSFSNCEECDLWGE